MAICLRYCATVNLTWWYLFAGKHLATRWQVDYSAWSFARARAREREGERERERTPPRLGYYFICDYKNARKGPPNRAINFYYVGRRVAGYQERRRGRVVNYSMRKREVGRQCTLSRFPLQIFPDPFNFLLLSANFPPLSFCSLTNVKSLPGVVW